MIRTHAVTVRAGGRTLLDEVDFEAPNGSITGIVGPNGSGKTTLLRTLVRATTVTSGQVTVDGHDIRTRSRRWIAQRISVVGQRLEPDHSLSVTDEIGLGGLAQHGVLSGGKPSFDHVVARALESVGLAHRATDSLATLSGGELQRVAIARALAHGAGHVLLDEPTNHLDVRHRLEILGLLRSIAPTVVIVLHDLELAARVCDHIVMLSRGQVIRSGSPNTVLQPEVLDSVYEVRTQMISGHDGSPHFSFTLPPSTAPAPPSIANERTPIT